AHPGTYVPGIDTTIQVGKIRGVESHGMMCSEREMELPEESSMIPSCSSESSISRSEHIIPWLSTPRILPT
ncbi:MAG: hypothetical protein AAGK93_13630, partial [Pseudomonadota bacterium]